MSWTQFTLLVIVVALGALFGIALSKADDTGHDKYHAEFYQNLMQPGTTKSCCNDQDCRPAKYRITKAGVEFFIGGKWITPPPHTVMQKIVQGGHWCGFGEKAINPHTYCAIVPFSGV